MADMTCRRCEAVGVVATFPDLASVRAHYREAHANVYIGGPRPVAGPPTGPAPRVRERGRGRRRIEDMTGEHQVSTGDGPAGPIPSDDGPEPSEDAPRSAFRPSRPVVSSPTIHITPELRAQSVSDAIRDALPLTVMADLIHTISVAVSEADGAGEPGHLSPIQCVQVATLLYDATIDLVVSRFGGNVTRFKASMAVLIILVAKGRVHGAAIRDRLRERAAAARQVPYVPPGDAVPEPAPGGMSPVEAAMRMQGARA